MARLDRRNATKYWCDRQVPGLSLMRADFTSHDYGRHTHEAFVIAVTEAGGAHVRSRNSVAAVSPRVLFVSNPEEPQSSWMGESECWRYRSIYLARPAIEKIARELGIEAIPYLTRSVIDDQDLIADFQRLHTTLEEGADDLRGRELLVDVLGTLFHRYGCGGSRLAPAARDRVLVDRVVGVMRARCSEKLRLSELAETVGMTTFQVIGLFKRTVGMTPHAFLVSLRLNRACHHLRRGFPLADSALEAGFCDQSALTKHFKRCYGITPLQFATATCVFRGQLSKNRRNQSSTCSGASSFT